MMVGVPRETKEGERRIALLPLAIQELTAAGHTVLVETHAALGIGIGDDDYRDAGADIVTAKDVWDCDLIVKVKEPQAADLRVMPRGATMFSFLHLTGEPERVRALAERGASAIAFEFVRDKHGRFPLLAPMSEIAGRMAIDVGRKSLGGPTKKVLVLGAGHAAREAAKAARLAGAEVTMLARTARDDIEAATPENVERHALEADLVVAAAFVAGQPSPKLIPRSLVRRMKRGAMIVDISIEEGGIAETSRKTTHANPTFVEEGVVHYCVGNMPAARPAEAAAAISEAALPYVMDMASEGVATALLENRELRDAVLLWEGHVVQPAIAEESGLAYTALTDSMLAESQ
jgi:alanine dehydrogenase